MNQIEKTRQLLIKHYDKYPRLQIRDLFKFIFQSSFGCEHMISSLDVAIDYIREESDAVTQADDTAIDYLDGEYSRVHLSVLKKGLSAETFGKLFFASAKKEPDGKAKLEKKLDVVRTLVREGAFPFSADELDRAIEDWRGAGYPAIHHSEDFRQSYKPAYRVIANEYVPFIPLFARLDTMLKAGRTVVAIEGGSASGKSTLGKILEDVYGGTVFHMDDFFLRPEQRNDERYAEIGGNIDRERFLEEVLIPLSKNETVNYRKFDCSTMTLSQGVDVAPEKLVVIEGAYSMHPDLEKYYDLSVFLDISPKLQSQRISKRNSPEDAERFYNIWIPLENKYFSHTKAEERCDIKIPID